MCSTAQLVHRSARALASRSVFAATVVFHALVALPLARRELARWRRRAQAIAQPELRERALETLRHEQANSEGAAAFAVLCPPAAPRVIPLLVAYQLAWDFVDTLLERPAPAAATPESICRTLEFAVVLDDRAPRPRAARAAGQGGDFLGELIDACRTGCAGLPRYAEAQPALRRLAARSDALLATNCARDRRIPALNAWAGRNRAQAGWLEPAELCAAAQCSLGIHALLATAARPGSRTSDFEAIESAYFPWINALCTLLDSVVDQDADARSGDFSFVAEYPSSAHGAERLRLIAQKAMWTTRTLPAGHRHAALTCAVVGMYAAAPSARGLHARPLADSAVDATAPLSRWASAVAGAQRRVLG